MIYTRLLFLQILLFPILLFGVAKSPFIVTENMISPDLEDFDCHSSSLIEVSPGILCAAWKGGAGKGESNGDMKKNVGIWLSFFKEGSWSQARQIVECPQSVCWSPVLGKLSTGDLILFYRVGIDPRHAISLCKISTDRGASWSREEVLPAGIVGPTKTKPLLMADGSLICGSSVEVGAPEDVQKATACWVEIFSGGQWSKYGPIEIPEKRFGCIEPALFLTEDGALKIICRDRSNRIGSQGWIWTAESKDFGKTWSELKKTSLPNPDSGVDALPLKDKNILLVYNHSHINRYPLSIAISKDDGDSWKFLFNIEEESGEFPSAALDSQGYVHISYAWTPLGKGQRLIKHVILGHFQQ